MSSKRFTSYVTKNLDAFTDYYELKDTKLIIHGSSLRRFLKASSGKEEIWSALYGGNYVKLQQVMVKFFGILKANNVEPLVICDGIERNKSDTEGSKRMHRLKYMVMCSKTVKFHHGVDAWPILYHESMMNVLKQLNIPVITTLFKSDTTIAYVANQLKCPVFSGKLVNYVYQLDGGFINCRQVKFDSDEKQVVEVIKCQIYRWPMLLQLSRVGREAKKLLSGLDESDYRLDDAMTCALDHLNGLNCSKHNPEDDSGSFLSEAFSVRFINESWILETLQIGILSEYAERIAVDDYTQPSSLKRVQSGMISYFIALLRDEKADNKRPVMVTDWKMSKPGSYEWYTFELPAVREAGSMKIPSLEEIKFLTPDSKISILMSIMGVSVDEFDTLNEERLEANGEEAAQVLSLFELLIDYMMVKESPDKHDNISHFKTAVISSVQSYLDAVEPLPICRRDVSNEIRVEVLYYFNTLLKLVRLYNQINLILNAPLPRIEANKCVNGLHIAYLYQSLKLGDRDTVYELQLKSSVKSDFNLFIA
ncbi:Protein asteroid [Halotydeus destructor]|nr:Protein asteroid [Halotydeus destructor]